MSPTKAPEPVYKVYEPVYPAHRTIIVDEQAESPETLTLRLEEAARNGGEYNGECPPGLLPMAMSAYKPQPASLHDPAYPSYSSQPLSSQQTEHAGQLNQMAFAVNSAAMGAYLGGQAPRTINHSPRESLTGGSGVGAPDDGSPPGLGSPRARSPVRQRSPPHSASQQRVKPDSPVAQHGMSDGSSANAYDFSAGSAAASTATHLQQHQAAVHSDFASAAPAGGYGQGNGSTMLSPYRSASLADPYQRPPPTLRSPPGPGWFFDNSVDALRTSASALGSSLPTPPSRASQCSVDPMSPPALPLVRTSTLPQTMGGFPGYGGHHEKAKLTLVGNLDSMAEDWTAEEWGNKRRLVVFKKKQTGSMLTVSFYPVSPAERPPHSICISCIWWEEKRACYVTSVDTIHLLEQLLTGPGGRFQVDEKNRIRRNLEGYRPATIGKQRPESGEFYKVIMGFGNPKPRNIEKDVKVFKWTDLKNALNKIVSKYSASTTAVMSHSSSTQVPAPLSLSSYSPLPPTPVSAASTTANDAASVSSYGGHHHPVDSLASPRSLAGAPSWQTSTYSSAASRTMSPSLKTSLPALGSSLRTSSTFPVVYDHRGATHSLTSSYGLATSASSHAAQLSGAHHGHAQGPAVYGAHHHHQHQHHQHVQQQHHHGVPQSTSYSGQVRSWDGYPVATDGYASQSGANTHATAGQMYHPSGGSGGGGNGGGYGDPSSRA
ncbi:hypothetical protein VTJ83DRAFT_5218 [Remersonia thermophila]|uniref:DUF7082 domain-containing protein n=1 Tax=Remersonia thermophila TaxID=72144 RepID=A0ABR4DC73_9PEZI